MKIGGYLIFILLFIYQIFIKHIINVLNTQHIQCYAWFRSYHNKPKGRSEEW